ncbi:MAG: double-strand break repair helicase AddA [Pseudomonadota bacterium]
MNEATRAQLDAADPDASTWLAANAGSGKTRVLTDRVARLLIQGVPPQNILCLTYTKAAAGEMQNRLFERLGEWAMCPDGPLRQTLTDLGAGKGVDLSRARTLFARAIETPGGLKIQTIHAFCAALLRRFPVEAGVSPAFREMDESAAFHLMTEILETLAEDDPGGAVTALASEAGGTELIDIALEIARQRTHFASTVTLEDLRLATDAPPYLDAQRLLKTVSISPDLLHELLAILVKGSPNDVKAYEKLSAIDPSQIGVRELQTLEAVLLFGESAQSPFGAKVDSFPTKDSRKLLGDAIHDLNGLMERMAENRDARLAIQSAERSIILHNFAAALLPAYETAKAERGLLDFDDLIAKAAHLLSDSASTAWVLYRLDAGIDHVLLDEAQDTSPAQWHVISRLVTEFGAGQGARPVNRTLFVVGDKKQSIYSFQGADAEAFDRMRDRFEAQLSAADGIRQRQLQFSFRSAPAILDTVDAMFTDTPVGDGARHRAFFNTMPGRVDLWPLVQGEAVPDAGEWFDPTDRVSPDHPGQRLAQTIADELHRLIRVENALLPNRDGSKWRHMTEGDILILVQSRTGTGDLFNSIIEACKKIVLSVAGADRLAISDELAVKDIVALLSFLALPEDDLSLATALRSPLFGWTEDDLFRLAHGRGQKGLWQTLRQQDSPTTAVLNDLRSAADFLRPYDLIERLLVRHRGRARLLARLGGEAEDGIDELLNQALRYEEGQAPSLTGFLAWFEGEAVEVKRSVGSAAGSIQVMTVHGAKGLERPVVILPDTMRAERQNRAPILLGDDGLPHWRPSPKDQTPRALAKAADRVRAAEAKERQRLLYVAATRAESWLILCGAEPRDKQNRDAAWYKQASDGLSHVGAVAHEMPTGTGQRYETGDWAGVAQVQTAPEPEPTPLPDWACKPLEPVPPAQKTIAPSDLGGAKALPGEPAPEADLDAPLRRGRQIHLLLENLPGLPAAQRPSLAVALLSHGEDAAPEEDAQALATEVGALLDASHLAHVFAPGALAEVDIAAPLGDRRMRGAIDRLIVSDTRVLAVDFKSNRVVPDAPGAVPAGILRQMAAYLSGLRQIFPDREIEVAILWTATADLMLLPHDIVMKALPEHAIS